ncbi:SDR family NAD(P)-dependent oxidoreductase [Shimia litoralis]|uniref:SDR family NAD(P)-dependent oxidoreductase n=1 Tax=Shimia litoralis TaxID=420403 RepID=A0A4U7N5C4_9RHOB|nr:SDR family NAD(P)-dependent oxidoreductase [Shimia litoralis]TKZ20773.1 SDR family NAD(P)-dependent oxidoreductase [Shimia litoralis]
MQKHALVIGASGGIGQALALELEARGDQVTRLSRVQDSLDITDEHSVSEQLENLETVFDLIFVATGILSGTRGPEKSLLSLSSDEMANLFAVNAIGPALVLKHVKRLLPKNKRCVFAALSARVGSIGDNHLGGWYSYRASKAALNQVIKTSSIEFKRTHKHLICVALHPGTVATEFTKNYPQHQAAPSQKAASHMLSVLDSLTPEDSGQFYDWKGKRVPW